MPRAIEARHVALYGLRRWAEEGLRAIAQRMGVGDTAVSHRVSAVTQRGAADRAWRLRLAALSESHVKT